MGAALSATLVQDLDTLSELQKQLSTLQPPRPTSTATPVAQTSATPTGRTAGSSGSARPRAPGSAFSFGRALGGTGARGARPVPSARTTTAAGCAPAPAAAPPARTSARCAATKLAAKAAQADTLNPNPPRPPPPGPQPPPSTSQAAPVDTQTPNPTGTAPAPPPPPSAEDWLEPPVQPSRDLPWQPAATTFDKFYTGLDPISQRVVGKLLNLDVSIKSACDTLHFIPSSDGRETQELRAELEDCLAKGEVFEAFPSMSVLAFYTLWTYGPEHPRTLDDMYSVIENLFQRDRPEVLFYSWLLPRAAAHYGKDHPRTRLLVQYAALHLGASEDPREHPELTQLVTDIAQQLPDGLGWGTSVVAPMPDQGLYNRNAVMQAKAEDNMQQGNWGLAREMLKRCLAYYETLGPHWLGSLRKVRTMQLIGVCVWKSEGAEAAEPILARGKRIGRQELGPTHHVTLCIMWQHAEVLYSHNRCEQALSLFMKTLRLRQETLGPRHYKVLQNQWAVARVLKRLNKVDEAEHMLISTFEELLKVGGPKGPAVRDACETLWELLMERKGRRRDANALKKRAERLGVDVSGCVVAPIRL